MYNVIFEKLEHNNKNEKEWLRRKNPISTKINTSVSG